MSSANQNLSSFNKESLPDVSTKVFGVVVAEWNHEITDALYSGAFNTLIEAGVPEKNIRRMNVPGSFELTSGAKIFADDKTVDAVICLGCVIQGETRHFDFICNAVSYGLTKLCTEYKKPFIFGLLTPNTNEQARERAGGKHGNKGIEAAVTAIKMVGLFGN